MRLMPYMALPEVDLASGDIMRVNTLFPSPTDERGPEGGVVLLKLKRVADGNGTVTLRVGYMDLNGGRYENAAEYKI